MNIIYLHGLDSDPSATKALITKRHASTLGLDIQLPDLNCPPDVVLDKVRALMDKNSVLIGSSLGGYFANLLSDMTGCACVLLNPSIRPDLSFQRFVHERFSTDDDTPSDDTVIYTTDGGWDILYQDLAWFERHRLTVKHPHKTGVLLKMGDELLDASQSQAFYNAKGASLWVQAGGDHRVSDYDTLVAQVLDWARKLHGTSA